MEDRLNLDMLDEEIRHMEKVLANDNLSEGIKNSTSGFLLHSFYTRNHRTLYKDLMENHLPFLLENAADSVKSLFNHINGVPSNKSDTIRQKCFIGTLVHAALSCTKTEIVKKILEKGMDVNWRIRCSECKPRNSDLLDLEVPTAKNIINCYEYDRTKFMCYRKLTALELAILVKNYDSERDEIIEMLLKNGINLSDETEQIHTLHLAVIANVNLFVIKKLIEYGADINSVCKKQCTPLSHAVSNIKDKKTIFYLLTRGAIFNVNTINSAFYDFVLNDEIFCEEIFSFIIDSGADINSRNEMGQTTLQVFINNRPPVDPDMKDQLQLFHDYGSDINVQDIDGNTPLHLAVKRGNVKGVSFLLESGADHTIPNAARQTVLSILDEERNLPSRTHQTQTYVLSDNYFSYSYNNPAATFEILWLVARTIVADADSGKRVNENDFKFVQNNLLAFNDSFKNELEKMKLKKIEGVRGLSLYDILTKSVNVLAMRLDRNIIKYIESSEILKDFNFYRDMIEMQIRMIKERQILTEYCGMLLKDIFHLEYYLPFLVTEEIFSFLSSVDLITLWRVFKRKGEYLSTFLNRPRGMTLLELS